MDFIAQERKEEPMKAIDGDALDDFLASAEIEAVEKKRYVLAGALNTVRGNLLNFPTIEPERKKGKWIPQDHNKRNGMITTAVYYYPKCSECGHVGDYSMNYCPSCGADMRGDTDGVDN